MKRTDSEPAHIRSGGSISTQQHEAYLDGQDGYMEVLPRGEGYTEAPTSTK